MPNLRVAEVNRLLFRTVGHKHSKPFNEKMVKRGPRRTKISTETVDLKVPHSAKTSQAWKYPGNRILRAPSKRLGSKEYHDHKDPSLPRRKQESNFFLTINTNKCPTTPNDKYLCDQALKNVLKSLSDEHYLAQYIKFGPCPKSGENYTDDLYTDVIHSVDWQANVETGDQLGRVHAHVWLTISHYSQVQINVHMLMYYVKYFYNAQLGLHPTLKMDAHPYVHVKLLPQSDWTDVMRQYIHKAMTDKARLPGDQEHVSNFPVL